MRFDSFQLLQKKPATLRQTRRHHNTETPASIESIQSVSTDSEASIRIVLIHRNRLFREAMAFALNKLNTFVVLDSVSEASDSVRKNSRLTPNIVLLEASDKSDSASVIAMISKLFAGARIIMLGLPDAEQDIIASIEAGAAGCVFRNASFLELVEIIGSAARGEVVLSPKTAASLCRRLAGFASSNKPLMGGNQPLTRREREIVPLIAGGLQNKEIAVRLGVEVQTVKNHVHNILEKLQVHSRHHIARHLNLLSVLTCFWFISAGRYGLYWCVFSYSA